LAIVNRTVVDLSASSRKIIIFTASTHTTGAARVERNDGLVSEQFCRTCLKNLEEEHLVVKLFHDRREVHVL
jgi:hypothetical protein